MKTITLKVDEATHTTLKLNAVQEGISLKEYLLKAVFTDSKEPTAVKAMPVAKSVKEKPSSIDRSRGNPYACKTCGMLKVAGKCMSCK